MAKYRGPKNLQFGINEDDAVAEYSSVKDEATGDYVIDIPDGVASADWLQSEGFKLETDSPSEAPAEAPVMEPAPAEPTDDEPAVPSDEPPTE
jgi:hypothetical protein